MDGASHSSAGSLTAFLAERLRRLFAWYLHRRQPSYGTKSGRKFISDHIHAVARLSITAEEANFVERVARATTGQLRFPRHLEAEFQRYMRLTTRMPRICVAFLTFLSFATASLWAPLVLINLPVQTKSLTDFVSIGIMAPMFAVVCLLQLRYAVSEFAEWLLFAAFLVEVAAIEVLRYNTESAGLLIEPSLTATVPIAVMGLTRMRVSRCLMFAASYIAIIATKQLVWPNHVYDRTSTEWLFEIILLSIGLLATTFSMVSARRLWASSVLLDLAVRKDSLTGLANRAAFEEHFEMLVGAAAREKKTIFLALIDLDHFKKVNDMHGHQYGDGVLIEIGLLLEQFARRTFDLTARIGGEEFAVVLYDCDQVAGEQRIETLLSSIRDLNLEHRESDAGVVTASAGCVAIPPGAAMAEAYQAADESLYRVKNSGRNAYLVSPRFRSQALPEIQDAFA